MWLALNFLVLYQHVSFSFWFILQQAFIMLFFCFRYFIVAADAKYVRTRSIKKKCRPEQDCQFVKFCEVKIFFKKVCPMLEVKSTSSIPTLFAFIRPFSSLGNTYSSELYRLLTHDLPKLNSLSSPVRWLLLLYHCLINNVTILPLQFEMLKSLGFILFYHLLKTSTSHKIPLQ